MIKTDEDALICDLAETYHIYDYRSLPVKTVATFSVGLRENSRIKRILAGVKYPIETLFLAAILDGININNWMKSKNCTDSETRPQSITNKLLGIEVQQENEQEVFDSADEFESRRQKLIGGN